MKGNPWRLPGGRKKTSPNYPAGVGGIESPKAASVWGRASVLVRGYKGLAAAQRFLWRAESCYASIVMAAVLL